MSDLHRHMPELAEAIDRIFNAAPADAGLDVGYDVDKLREDIAVCSHAALIDATHWKQGLGEEENA